MNEEKFKIFIFYVLYNCVYWKLKEYVDKFFEIEFYMIVVLYNNKSKIKCFKGINLI